MTNYTDEPEYSFAMERFTGIDQGMEGNDTPLQASRSAENCDTSGGALKLARGWAFDASITAAPDGIRSLMVFHKNNGDGSDTDILLAATDGGLYRWAGSAWQDIAGANPVSSGRFSWINYQKDDKAMIILANGSDDVYCWEGEGEIAPLAADADWTQGQPMADGGKNQFTLTQHGLSDGDMVVFFQDKGTLPSGITEKDTYFVIKATPDRFLVSTKKGGTAVNMKTDGKAGWRVSRAKWLGDNDPTASGNTIHAPNHGLLPDDEVIFDHFVGGLPSGISDNKVYYAIVTSQDDFQISASANNPMDIVSFGSDTNGGWEVRKADVSSWLTGAPSASAKTGMFTLTNHGLKETDANGNPTAIEFGVNAAAVLPMGLAAGTPYYVVSADTDTFKISEDSGGRALDIAGNGFGGWAVRKANESEWLAGTIAVNYATNTFTLENHGLAPGDEVVFGIPDENSFLPEGLRAGRTYYAKVLNADTLQLLAGPLCAAPVRIESAGLAGWSLKKAGGNWLSSPAAHPENDSISAAGHGLVTGDAVVFGLDPAQMLPGGLTAGQTYYVLRQSAGTFKLSASKNGPAVNLSSAGGKGWRIRPSAGPWKPGIPSYNASSDVITLANHGFANGDAAVVGLPDISSFMPSGITAHDGTPQGKYYYVVRATDSTFMVADKPHGTPVMPQTAGMPVMGVRPSRENRPMGDSLALHYERIWCAGEKSRPDSVFFSDVTDPTNWAIGENGAGVIDKPSWDGDAVTAVANLFDNIAVFKSGSMFRIAGTSPDEYQVAPVLSTAGTVSPATVRQWQDAAFFLSPLGIMAYDGTKCEPLGGDALKDFWTAMNTDRAALAGACAAVHGGHLLTALPSGKDDNGTPIAYNNTVVDFDIAAGTYMLRTGVRVDSWLPGDPLRFASGNRVCLWGEDTNGNAVYAYGNGDGSAIPMRWETPGTDFGARDSVKTVTCVSVTGSGGDLKITVNADGKAQAKTITLPGSPGVAKARFNASGRLISVALENVNGSNVEISGVTISYERDDD